MNYEKRRRLGSAKRFEQAGDYVGMVEAMAKTAEIWGDLEEAKRLRASLNPQPIAVPQEDDLLLIQPEPAYTPEAKSKKQQSKRGRKVNKPPKAPPLLSPQQLMDEAWRELGLKRGYDY
jgi:hypothetical protein